MTVRELVSTTYKEENIELWLYDYDYQKEDPYLGMFHAGNTPKEYYDYKVVTVQTSFFYDVEHKMKLYMYVLVEKPKEDEWKVDPLKAAEMVKKVTETYR